MTSVRDNTSKFSWLLVLLVIVAGLVIYLIQGYNKLQGLDEETTAKWSEVVNQYQRRTDLVPNLVETVKTYAKHEKEVFRQVTEARAKVGSISITPEVLNNPEALTQFQQAQGQLAGALSKLIAVAENYPDLKANTTFENLMAQLEGTENRISVARKRYIETVHAYNTLVRQFPTNLIAKRYGIEKKANFSVKDEATISQAPRVSFE